MTADSADVAPAEAAVSAAVASADAVYGVMQSFGEPVTMPYYAGAREGAPVGLNYEPADGGSVE